MLLSGFTSAVAAARAKLVGTDVPDGAAYWEALREHRLPFYAADRPLWRLSVAQTAAPVAAGHPQLVEWGGGLRWASGALEPARARELAANAKGHATLCGGGHRPPGGFPPLAPALAKIHRRLKDAFDPAGILNPGRMDNF